MRRIAVLEQVTLADQMGNCTPLDQIPAGVVPSLDLGEVRVRNLGPSHVECIIEFEFDLATPRDQEVVCDISAAFRVVYKMTPLRTKDARRDWAATRAVVDVWPYWRAYLTSTMTWMGLQPLHLLPEPPEQLAPSAREAFDATLQVDQGLAAEAEKRANKGV